MEKSNALPVDIASLLEETRNCVSNEAFTGAVLLCKKVLMHLAVSKGASQGKKFSLHIDYLSTNNIVPFEYQERLDHIASKIDKANHDIVLMSEEDAEEVTRFTGMLLRSAYE